MVKKIKNIILLMITLLGFSSCSYATTNSSTLEEKTVVLTVKYDYGFHIKDKVAILLNDSTVWFNPKDYNINTLVAGDELIIKYTGEFMVQETYPSQVVTSKLTIQSIEVIEANIIEFRVSGSDDISLVSLDPKYTNYTLSNVGYVVDQEFLFKKYEEYPEDTILYGSVAKSSDSIEISCLYDYNPREN